MRGRSKLRMMVACLVLLPAVGAMDPRCAFGQAIVGPDVKSRTNCLLHVTFDSNTNLLNSDTIQALLNNSVTVHSAIRKVSGLSFGDSQANPRMKWPSVGAETLGEVEATGVNLIRLEVYSYDDRLPAEELRIALVDVLRTKLRELDAGFQKRNLRRLEQLQNQSNSLQRDFSQKRTDLSNFKAGMNQSGLDRESREALLLKLHFGKQELELEKRALEVRAQSLERMVAQLAKRVEETIQKDPIIEELTGVVNLREDAVKIMTQRYKTQAEAGGPEAVIQAGAESSLARVELAKYRMEASHRAGGEQVMELERQLVATSVELAEATVRLKSIDEKIAESRVNESFDIEIRRWEIESKEKIYRELRERVERELIAVKLHEQPTVTVIIMHGAEGSSRPEESQKSQPAEKSVPKSDVPKK